MTRILRELASGVASLADVLGLRDLPPVYDFPPDRARDIDLLLLVDDAALVSSELATTIDESLPARELIHA